jgi:hypothetical protein
MTVHGRPPIVARYVVVSVRTKDPDIEYRIEDTQSGNSLASCWARSNADTIAAALNAARPEGGARNEVVLLASEYAQLVKDARRYEWLRDHMRRMPLGEAGTRHFFDQPGTMSFQEAVDEATESPPNMNSGST